MHANVSSADAPRARVWVRRFALVVALACCIPVPVVAQVFGPNLIVNGNAETGPGSPDGTTLPVPNAPGWALTGNFTVVQYNAPGGFPLSTDPGPPTRGANYFAGGNNASSSAAQTINVAAGAAAIDAGTATYSLSGWLGGFSSQDDNATLTVTFRNAGATAIGSATIGPVTATDRGSATGMLLRNAAGAVPVGTRTIDVVLQLTRVSGTYNDGYADELSLVLAGPAVASSQAVPLLNEWGLIALIGLLALGTFVALRRQRR
jgi:hypothetical protein